ncbi:MAG: ankyrin repeat domain-containing protein [Burkholderiales bacterium]|nr:ankyrin repeat domain-containing protein [Burkholderiales bacterium]
MSERPTPARSGVGDRPDPLLDAYRQASAHEGRRPSPSVRDAVLAHARAASQQPDESTHRADTTALHSTRTMPGATVSRAAANDAAWYWRVAAGLVIGVLGVWGYRVATLGGEAATVASAPVVASPAAPVAAGANAADTTRDSATTPPQVASASPVADAALPTAAAPSARTESRGTGAAGQKAQSGGNVKTGSIDRMPGSGSTAAPTSPVPDVPPVAVYAPSAVGMTTESTGAAAVATASPAATLAVTPPAAPAAPPPPAAVLAARSPQPLPAAPAGAMAAPPADETVAMAEMAKRTATRVAKAEQPAPASDSVNRDVGAAGALLRAERTAPNTEMRAKAAAVASASAPPARIGDMTPPMQQGMANVALFSALRAGQVDAVRNAIVRGANVNARDDQGRTPLQIARESNQTEVIRLLEAAGAK